jgi:hypothetical protein
MDLTDLEHKMNGTTPMPKCNDLYTLLGTFKIMEKKMIILAIGLGLLIFGFMTIPEIYGYICSGVGGFVFGWGLATKQ